MPVKISVLLLWHAFLITFTALLPLINPLGSALVFLGLAGDAPPSVHRSIARQIAINNVIFLTVFDLLGSAILRFFGISLPIVQVAGGIVIAAIGWSVLNEKDASSGTRDKQEQAQTSLEDSTRTLEQKAFYPFTFPVTSGPGTLVVLLTVSARFGSSPLADNIVAHVGLLLAIAVLSALVYVCYANASRITRKISSATAHGILRVVAFILLCIGVQIAWSGFSVLILALLHHQS